MSNVLYVISVDVFLPSEWRGNYTCDDDKREIIFIMNITKSSSTIGLSGDMYIDNKKLEMAGSFASFFKIFALQSDLAISSQIANRNFTKVELNGKVQSSVFINGAAIFLEAAGKRNCPMELRRTAGKAV
jgi:hypothetical protein